MACVCNSFSLGFYLQSALFVMGLWLLFLMHSYYTYQFKQFLRLFCCIGVAVKCLYRWIFQKLFIAFKWVIMSRIYSTFRRRRPFCCCCAFASLSLARRRYVRICTWRVCVKKVERQRTTYMFSYYYYVCFLHDYRLQSNYCCVGLP